MHILTPQQWRDERKAIMHDGNFWIAAAFIVLAWLMILSWFIRTAA